MRGSADVLYIGQESVAIIPPFTTPFQEEERERNANCLVQDPVAEEGGDQENESFVVPRHRIAEKKEIKQDDEMQYLVTEKKVKDQINETDVVLHQPATDYQPQLTLTKRRELVAPAADLQPRHTDAAETELSSNPILPNTIKEPVVNKPLNMYADRYVQASFSPGKPSFPINDKIERPILPSDIKDKEHGDLIYAKVRY